MKRINIKEIGKNSKIEMFGHVFYGLSETQNQNRLSMVFT